MAKEENRPINGLIFKELIRRGYSVEDGVKEWNIADSKLWYLTSSQAQAYLDLENSKEYTSAVNEELSNHLIVSRAKEIIDWADKDIINVVDLGCGDGKKAALLIKALGNKGKVRYCPIDISGYMVKKAIETFKKEKIADIIEFRYNISDFENLENVIPLLEEGPKSKNLILLLGNTLGNFEINELLYKIRLNMNSHDLLLIDTAIADEKVKERAISQAKNKKVDSFLRYIPTLLGLKNEDVEYSTRFLHSRIEFFYTLLNSQTIKLREHEVIFNKGDRIVVAIAYKHNEKDLLTYLNLYFDNVQIEYSEDRSQISSLCRK